MPTAPLSQVLGTTRSFAFTIRNDAGQPVTDTFLSGDPLSANVWSGDDQATLIQPSMAWIVPEAGTVKITISASQLADISPGTYRLQAFVIPQSDGQRRNFLDGSIRFLPTAGAAAAPPAYATYDDMEIYCPQVMKLQDLVVDQANFAQQRARARTWFDRDVIDYYNPQPGRARREVDPTYTSAGPFDRFADIPTGATVPTKAQIKEYLDGDRLILTDDIREANAHKAAALVYLSQPGQYAEMGRMHEDKAEAARCKAIVEIDTNGLGTENIRVGRDVTFLH